MKKNLDKSSLAELYRHSKPTEYYETDAMGVIHHSNFIRFFEETRVAWLRDRDLIRLHTPQGDTSFAVLSVRCEHLHPVFFGDVITTYMQVQRLKLKVQFEYAIFTERYTGPVALGTTLHIPLDRDLKIATLPEPIGSVLEKEKWTETWL